MRRVLLAGFLLVMASAAAARGGDPLTDPPRASRLTGGLIVTGHVLPVDTAGRVVGTDVGTQTKLALGNLDALLKSNGSSLARTASIHVYLRHATDFGAMNAAYAQMFGADPPARTTIVGEPALAGALLQVSAVAVTEGAPREVVHPAAWPKSPSPYSYGIKSGDTLFLAGLIARRGLDNTVVEGDVATQTAVVLQNAQAILDAAGMSFADVVSSRVFITDRASFQAMNEAYRGAFPEPRPARATVVCGLTGPAFKVEIALTAVKAQKSLVVAPREDGSPGTAGPNFSPALRVGERVYLSGLLGNSPSSQADLGAQSKVALASASRLLQAAGAGPQDVVDATIYVTDAQRGREVRETLRAVLGHDRAAVVIAGTGLVVDEGLVEIMLTARTAR